MNEFKLIVAGGRDFNKATLLHDKLFEIANTVYKDKAVSLISGMARGADELAYQLAIRHGIKVYTFPAKWSEHGKSAGFIRNSEMANAADGLLAFWDYKSKGTQHMIQTMQRHGKDVFIVKY